MFFRIVISFFVFVNVAAQSTIINRVVCDSADKTPLDLVNVQILDSKKGTVSNKFGQFDIMVKPDQQLKFSVMGYESKIITYDDLLGLDSIFLARKVIELDELKVYSTRMSANDIVRMAMGKTAKLSSAKPYAMKAFYRHSCSENDVYGRLIEAALELSDNKGHKKKYNEPNEKIGIKVNQVRRSFDFTQNFDEHDPISIYSTLKYDVYSYTSFLHFYPEDFNFQLVDTTFYDNALVWVITYQYEKQKEKGLQKDLLNCKGWLYIRSSDFGILEVKEEQNYVQESEYETHCYDLNWDVKYQEYEGKYYLKYLLEKGQNRDVLKNTNHEIISNKDHAFKVEMMVSDIQLTDVTKFETKEPTKPYLDALKYDSLFWKSYLVIQNSPLEMKVIEDLEKRATLTSQFEK